MVNNKKIRVLIVEDTLVGQSLLKGLLAEDARFEVVGVALNGRQAVEFVASLGPDVVSMDIYMPVMDGVEATRLIMESTPVPIVIVSSFYNPSEIKMSFSILEAGALTILPRPFGPGHPQFTKTARNYRNTLKMMSEVKVAPRRKVARNSGITRPGRQDETDAGQILTGADYSQSKIIAIGASAGGPQAIQSILQELPKSIPVPVMIVQHIDTHFAAGYADWLNTTSNLPVHIATNGEIMLPGHVYLPPGDHHLGLQRDGIIAVTTNPPEKGLRPAVGYLFNNVNLVYGKHSVCILLSGMGVDGAIELKMLRVSGALTIVQDAQTALVYGMPGEAIRLGGAVKVLPPGDIVKEIVQIFTILK